MCFRRLKGDLQLARRKGALKCGVIQSGRSCSRCRAELGRIINRGAFCRACRHRVCKSCREYSSSQTTEWVCTVCFKHMQVYISIDVYTCIRQPMCFVQTLFITDLVQITLVKITDDLVSCHPLFSLLIQYYYYRIWRFFFQCLKKNFL